MYGNGLDMRGHVDSTFRSNIPGGICLIRRKGDYSGPGGVWEEEEKFASVNFIFSFDNDTGVLHCQLKGVHKQLTRVNVQPAKWREVSLLVGQGGTAVISDFRTVHINDGKTYLMPDESGQYRDLLEFSDGVKMRRWRVMSADNRPWRNFCRAVVEVIREQ
jgi:hypothetical protein